MAAEVRAWKDCPTCGPQHPGCDGFNCCHCGQVHEYIGMGDYRRDVLVPCPTCAAHFADLDMVSRAVDISVDEAVRVERGRCLAVLYAAQYRGDMGAGNVRVTAEDAKSWNRICMETVDGTTQEDLVMFNAMGTVLSWNRARGGK